MKPSQLTQIVVRLFAISWLLHAIIQTVSAFAMNGYQLPEVMFLVSGTVALILASVGWLLAPTIGRLIAGKNDQEAVISGISFKQLLHAMFVGIGLFFCLSSIGGVLTSLHFLTVVQAAPESALSGLTLSPYDISKSLLTFAAGFFVLITAPILVRKTLRE